MRSVRELGRVMLVWGTVTAVIFGSGTAGARERVAGRPADAPPQPIWSARYDGPSHGADTAIVDAVSPDGSMVFVTGTSPGPNGSDITTIAYDSATGNRLWVRRYDGPAHGEDDAWMVVASPDGTAVLVIGQSTGISSGFDYAVIALDPSTGDRLWVRRYDGPGHGEDVPISLKTSPNGSRLFVTGSSTGSRGDFDYATLALDVATGRLIWVSRYDGPAHGDDEPGALTVGPNGVVYVLGGSPGVGTGSDVATVAYSASTGHQGWVARYDGPTHGDDGNCILTCVETSPDGSQVFVLAQGPGIDSGADIVTIAYRGSTGHEEWVARYDGPAHLDDYPSDLAALPDGSGVVVAGLQLSSPTAYYDDVTIRYASSNGDQLWATVFDNPSHGEDYPSTIVASPDGGSVVLTGVSNTQGSSDPAGRDIITQAYATGDGGLLWTARFDGPSHAQDDGSFIVLAPDGGTAFVTGDSTSGPGGLDFETLAYSLS
jgi:hypothetical protein